MDFLVVGSGPEKNLPFEKINKSPYRVHTSYGTQVSDLGLKPGFLPFEWVGFFLHQNPGIWVSYF